MTPSSNPGSPATTVIVALDVPTSQDAMAMASRLGNACRFYKVGSELFTREGPAVVRALCDRGNQVFLDLKFHDIPNTVRKASEAACAMGVSLLTVHASGGQAMLQAAVEGAGNVCGVLAVTVLTSLAGDDLAMAWGRDELTVEDEVLRLATLARGAGAHGIVCGGREAAQVRSRFGLSLASLVPGIRLPGGAAHDQARSVTPGEAARAGARYIVLGRAVTGAADPSKALAECLADVAHVGAER